MDFYKIPKCKVKIHRPKVGWWFRERIEESCSKRSAIIIWRKLHLMQKVEKIRLPDLFYLYIASACRALKAINILISPRLMIFAKPPREKIHTAPPRETDPQTFIHFTYEFSPARCIYTYKPPLRPKKLSHKKISFTRGPQLPTLLNYSHLSLSLSLVER